MHYHSYTPGEDQDDEEAPREDSYMPIIGDQELKEYVISCLTANKKMHFLLEKCALYPDDD